MQLSKKDLQSIRGALRTAFIRSEYKKSFLNSICLKEYKIRKDGSKYSKPTSYFICSICLSKHLLKDCKVDHINPIGQYFDFDHTTGFIERLWCTFDNLQGLCDSCHKDKTKQERGLVVGYAKL